MLLSIVTIPESTSFTLGRIPLCITPLSLFMFCIQNKVSIFNTKSSFYDKIFRIVCQLYFLSLSRKRVLNEDVPEKDGRFIMP